MGKLRQKQPRLALNQQDYDELKAQVLQRDAWKCQCCGTASNLHVHHIPHRSHMGSDELSNLITLCASCHQRQHLRQ
jgi:5-methylcytosine-specific restriction endonuclease McrA